MLTTTSMCYTEGNRIQLTGYLARSGNSVVVLYHALSS